MEAKIFTGLVGWRDFSESLSSTKHRCGVFWRPDFSRAHFFPLLPHSSFFPLPRDALLLKIISFFSKVSQRARGSKAELAHKVPSAGWETRETSEGGSAFGRAARAPIDFNSRRVEEGW